jgi:hypothetical protein
VCHLISVFIRNYEKDSDEIFGIRSQLRRGSCSSNIISTLHEAQTDLIIYGSCIDALRTSDYTIQSTYISKQLTEKKTWKEMVVA